MAEAAVAPARRQEVMDAIDVLRANENIVSITGPRGMGDGWYEVIADVAVALPSRARAAGISSTGVRHQEPVTFHFSPGYPLQPPSIGLRADFPKHFPHINPSDEGDLVRPCLSQDSVKELLQRDGLGAIVQQAVIWLHKAAAGELIDQRQGWEPTRRDETVGALEFDASRLAGRLPTLHGIAAFHAGYFATDDEIHGFVHEKALDGKAPPPRYFQELKMRDGASWCWGATALFVAHAKQLDAAGALPVNDQYAPDGIKTIADFRLHAVSLGINADKLFKDIEDFFETSRIQQKTYSWPFGLIVFVVLAVRRPIALIGSPGMNVEFIPYAIKYMPTSNKTSRLADKARISRISHTQSLSSELLAYLSGTAESDRSRLIIQLGCGSLGSKIALHLGRSGFGRFHFIDKSYFRPHNAARHALVSARDMSRPKVHMMVDTFQELAHSGAKGYPADIVNTLNDPKALAAQIPPDSAVLIDATASLQVLEALSSTVALDDFQGRIVRSTLFADGRVSVAMLEGTGRSSRLDDINTSLFVECRRNIDLRNALTGPDTTASRVYIGQNCSSTTLRVADSVISVGAATVAVQLEKWFSEDFPAEGQLCFGHAGPSGIGVHWTCKSVGTTVQIKHPKNDGWEVRVLANVVAQIDEESRRYGVNETGGALLGRVSRTRRCITIADVVAAPRDSQRNASRFILGTEGLEDALIQAHADSAAHLMFVGTWHSHPLGGDPSPTDTATLSMLARFAQGQPAVILIWTPGGLIARVERSS